MKSLKNQKGVLTFDFIFGMTLITGFFILLLIVNFTLSVVESIQYIAFATARSYYAADVNQQDQQDAAKKKYNTLIDGPIFKKLLKSPTWFKFHRNAEDVAKDLHRLPDNDETPTGAKIKFTAKVLYFSLPFIGDTANKENVFKTSVNAYMGREPSADECKDFNTKRIDKIKGFGGDYSQLIKIENLRGDNGC